MSITFSAIAYSAFLWWFSTGLIFYLNARPAHTFRWSMLGGTLVLGAALYGVWASAGSDTVLGAFIAFSCGVIIWGWHTMSYYMGVITGPVRTACPADCGDFKRFFRAVATMLYHELAIIATVALLFWMTREQPNPVALWTFVLLWVMQISAKLNVFLGVRNLNEEFIPQRLSYLTTYFRQKPMNLLFPFSITAGTVITLLLAEQAGAADPGSIMAVGCVLLATLMALAVIEHWFMILPIPAEALWRWSIKASATDAEKHEADHGKSSRIAGADAGDSISSLSKH